MSKENTPRGDKIRDLLNEQEKKENQAREEIWADITDKYRQRTIEKISNLFNEVAAHYMPYRLERLVEDIKSGKTKDTTLQFTDDDSLYQVEGRGDGLILDPEYMNQLDLADIPGVKALDAALKKENVQGVIEYWSQKQYISDMWRDISGISVIVDTTKPYQPLAKRSVIRPDKP